MSLASEYLFLIKRAEKEGEKKLVRELIEYAFLHDVELPPPYQPK